jgi:lysophospholipase L1-like esterase
MHRRSHAHRRTRPPLRVALLMLAVGAVLLMAPTERSSRNGSVALAADTAATLPSIAPAFVASRLPTARAPATMGALDDTLHATPVPTRPAVTVPAPEPRVAFGAPRGSTAVFLGDSFTSGWNGAGMGARSWPRLVADDQGWRTVNLAVPGTGFINPGWTSQPIGSRVAEAIRRGPDVIVVAAGHNDSRWSAAATAKAADDVIDRLHVAAPDALLMIVAPIWQNDSPPQRCLAFRDHLRLKAASIGAVFIDPLAGGWFGGASHRLIGPDGLHPTDAGHRFIAGRVLTALGGG